VAHFGGKGAPSGADGRAPGKEVGFIDPLPGQEIKGLGDTSSRRIILDRGAMWQAQFCKNLEKAPNFSPESVAGSQNIGPTQIRHGYKRRRKLPALFFRASKGMALPPSGACGNSGHDGILRPYQTGHGPRPSEHLIPQFMTTRALA
jgi:hypothetical protein